MLLSCLCVWEQGRQFVSELCAWTEQTAVKPVKMPARHEPSALRASVGMEWRSKAWMRTEGGAMCVCVCVSKELMWRAITHLLLRNFPYFPFF